MGRKAVSPSDSKGSGMTMEMADEEENKAFVSSSNSEWADRLGGDSSSAAGGMSKQKMGIIAAVACVVLLFFVGTFIYHCFIY